MVFADTSVWIDHLRAPDPAFTSLLNRRLVHGHPMLTLEIALGSLNKLQRAAQLDYLDRLPSLKLASLDDLCNLLETRKLWSRGIGVVDLNFLASTFITPGVRLMTRDRSLAALAAELGIAA